MVSSISLDQVKDALRKHICAAAQDGLNNANNNLGQPGKFEDKFQDGFVRSFKRQEAAFPNHQGTIVIVSLSATSWFPGGNV